jgi:phosphomannomutase
LSSSTTDKYGIKKLYADATGSAAQIWYLAMSGNPLSDPRVDSADDLTMTMSSDGGWILDRPDEPDPSIRLYAYSESGTKKWLNIEITNYSYLIRDTDPGASSNPDLIADYVFHLYTRG